MGIKIYHTTATGRARCQMQRQCLEQGFTVFRSCDRLIEKGELCVYATSTNVPSAAKCSGYVCWGCFTQGLTKAKIKAQERREKALKAKNKKLEKMTEGMLRGA